ADRRPTRHGQDAPAIGDGHAATATGRDGMIDTRHDEFVDAAAAYALGALDAADRVRFETHLRSCDACQQEIESYRGVIAGIGGGIEPIDPPPALKARAIAAAMTAASVRPFEPRQARPIRKAPSWLVML